jgi:pilus assembly protein CpaB
MNQRLMTILLSAFCIAAAASFVVYRLVGKQLSDNAKHRNAKTVIAIKDLEVGAIIKASDLKTESLTTDPPKDAVTKIESAVGRGVLTPIYAGEPVIEKRLAIIGSGGGLAATIPAGMRACAVKVDNVVGVDVLISGNLPGDRDTAGTKVKTLLQNIEVLSAGKNFQPDSEGKPVEVPVVNLLVTPEQAETLSLASNQARIQLILRNPIDHQVSAPPGTDLASLFGRPERKPLPVPAKRVVAPASLAAPKAEPPAPPPLFVVKVLNGGKQSEQKFDLQEDAR